MIARLEHAENLILQQLIFNTAMIARDNERQIWLADRSTQPEMTERMGDEEETKDGETVTGNSDEDPIAQISEEELAELAEPEETEQDIVEREARMKMKFPPAFPRSHAVCW